MHTTRNVDVAGRTALRLLPKIKLPFMLIFGSEDFVKPVTPEETAECEDIEVRVIPGGKHNIFDGDNIYADRTLESIMCSVEKYCGASR